METWEVKEKIQFVKVYAIEGFAYEYDKGYAIYPPILIPF